MYMEVSRGLNIRICDTLNFLPMRLAALPKAFGLTELAKGYFPHYANTRDNQNYIGPYPSPEKYGADFMNEAEREKFLQWHSEKMKNGAVFNFREEMETYCRSDVDILRRACIQFRKLMMDATSVDPFRYVTIASVCMAIYKAKFLENTLYQVSVRCADGNEEKGLNAKHIDGKIHLQKQKKWEPLDESQSISSMKPISSKVAQVASTGYIQHDTFSKASIQWLEYLMEIGRRDGKNVRIQHALNFGEVSIPGTRYKVDGLDSDTVYEYHGE